MPSRKSEDFGDPVGNYNFKLEINGVATALVSKVAFSSAFGGRAGQPGKITLQGVVPLDRPGAERIGGWHSASQGGARAWRNVAVVKYDRAGRQAQYNFFEAWPSKWKGFSLDGKGSDAGVSVRGWDFADKKAIVDEVELNHTGLRLK